VLPDLAAHKLLSSSASFLPDSTILAIAKGHVKGVTSKVPLGSAKSIRIIASRPIVSSAPARYPKGIRPTLSRSKPLVIVCRSVGDSNQSLGLGIPHPRTDVQRIPTRQPPPGEGFAARVHLPGRSDARWGPSATTQRRGPWRSKRGRFSQWQPRQPRRFTTAVNLRLVTVSNASDFIRSPVVTAVRDLGGLPPPGVVQQAIRRGVVTWSSPAQHGKLVHAVRHDLRALVAKALTSAFIIVQLQSAIGRLPFPFVKRARIRVSVPIFSLVVWT
jgi:hypothetical protein